MKAFVRDVRLREGYLSKSQVLGTVREKVPWNVIEHELALARMASKNHSSRSGRLAAWRSIQANPFASMCTQTSSVG